MSIDLAFAEAFGFDPFFQNQLPGTPSSKYQVARIIHEEKNLYRLQCSTAELRWAELSGRLFYEMEGALDRPAVGDWVSYKSLENSDRAVILSVLSRKTCLYRKAAGDGVAEQILGANIDTVFVMSSLNNELNLRRLERYFVLCRESHVQPVLILTKRDLCSNEYFEAARLSIEQEYPGIPIFGISVNTRIGIDDLGRFLLPGHTIALLGSSGVGKSTLTNRLLQSEILKTQPIREDDSKGRHTTTGRHLLLLPSGALILDTPGMRELQLMDHHEGVSEVFDDIVQLATKCRFSNCVHDTEPGCAIQVALESGEISMARWKSYLKIQRELTFQIQKADKATRSAQKEKWKKIHKEQRQFRRTRK